MGVTTSYKKSNLDHGKLRITHHKTQIACEIVILKRLGIMVVVHFALWQIIKTKHKQVYQ